MHLQPYRYRGPQRFARRTVEGLRVTRIAAVAAVGLLVVLLRFGNPLMPRLDSAGVAEVPLSAKHRTVTDTNPQRKEKAVVRDIMIGVDDSMPLTASEDVHLFVIWHAAMHVHRRILDDLGQRFIPVAVSLYVWPGMNSTSTAAAGHGGRIGDEVGRQFFEDNLWRLYSGKGGWLRHGMKLKVQQCGFGPFIAIVVIDPAPVYRNETTAHGIDHVNHNMNNAKKQYRKWAGGGFKVHGTFNNDEASHDIALLFHREARSFVQLYKETGRPFGTQLLENFTRGLPFALSNLDVTRQRNANEPRRDAHAVWSRLLAAHLARGGARETKLTVAHRWLRYREAATVRGNPDRSNEWLIVPFVSEYPTFGFDSWPHCADLIIMLRLYRGLRIRAHGDGLPLEISDEACQSWPAEIDVDCGPHNEWAVVAAIGGAAVGEQVPPRLFAINITSSPRGTRHLFHILP